MRIPVTYYEEITPRTTLRDLFNTAYGFFGDDGFWWIRDYEDEDHKVVVEKGYLVYTI